MKLLYITNGISGAGGLERVLSVKASLLAEDFGYEVHILSLNENGKETFFPFSKKIVRHSLEVSGNAYHYFSKYKNGLKNVVEKIQPDVISVCDDGLKGFFVPKILGKKIPVIYERHASVQIGKTGNPVADFKSSIQHSAMKFLAKDFSKFVVLTHGNLSEWNSENLKVIPNPVSFYPEKSANLQQKKVIAVGSHSYNKGYDRLLQIWQKTESHFPDWTLEIFGKSTLEKKFENLSQQMGLKNVHFHPPTFGIEEEFLNSSVLVFPSRSEGFGMVIIEAMSCGLPVVSFDCPHGPADIINDGKDGFLIEDGNISSFAEKLASLMQDQNLRSSLGSEGKQTAKSYLPEIIVKKWDQLFKEII